jgi:Flp pilus assembly protein TadG
LLVSRQTTSRDERGGAAIFMALSLTMILVAAAMVLDFGLIRLDRQSNKSVSDSAVMAGLRAADDDTSDIYTLRGVCGALSFLRANKPELAGLPDSMCAGSWQTSDRVCDQANPNASTSLTDYVGTVTANSTTYNVEIKAPYQLSDGNWPEESLSTLASDPSLMNGCDQLAVMITESRRPGLGGLVANRVSTRTRTVGRIHVGAGMRPPALLLLERTKCSVLVVGSNGSPSSIKVNATMGVPGTIHADSNATGSDCGSGSNQQLFQGHQTNAIEAGAGSATAPGVITSRATYLKRANNIVWDDVLNVHGLTSAGGIVAPTGQNLVTRRPIDDRYATGVRSSLAGAATFWTMNPTNALPQGWQKAGCNPSASDLSFTGSLYIDCPQQNGITLGSGSSPITINASTVFFNGWLKGGGLHMPNATRVYVNNTDSSGNLIKPDAIAMTGGDALCVQATACDSANLVNGECPTTPGSGNAKFFVRRGGLAENGGLLRLCHTTVYLMGGQTDGCVPATNGAAPTTTPCLGQSDTLGNGQLKITGGSQDWSAPNAYAGLIPPADQVTAWTGAEDLALWSESGSTTSTKFTMNGGGSMRIVGIYMTPNALPFQLTGGAAQSLVNAQFIASSFSLGGNSNLTMTVDPNNAVTIPQLDRWTLVR